MFFLSLQHGARLYQKKTRRELAGPFWKDYADSVTSIEGWGDGDGVVTNYVGHPMQGAITGYIQVQNDPVGMGLEFQNTSAYWKSRLLAMGWSACYSTQFEVGLISESTIGNVGKKAGTSGLSDFVITPAGGFGLMVAEDSVDRHFIRRLEARTASVAWRRFYRVALNPSRSVANILRLKVPWHRDTRVLRW